MIHTTYNSGTSTYPIYNVTTTNYGSDNYLQQ